MNQAQRVAEISQRRYYAATADRYDADHVHPHDAHFVALSHMSGLASGLELTSVLDVGSGTGRAAVYLKRRHPQMQVTGLEPVIDLLRNSDTSVGANFVCGSGSSLPFPDDSFDAVCATGLLHHVPVPSIVVHEMIRVARRVVMISDANRFGQGRPVARVAKLAISRFGFWPIYMKIRTGGKGYQYSEGDGIFYSYSIYDSAPTLDKWADRTFVIPTSTCLRGGYKPLLSAPGALLVAIRDQPPVASTLPVKMG